MSHPFSYHLVSVVWGHSYLNTFLDLVLPTYLAPKNIPFLSQTRTVLSKIYTRPEDVSFIENHPHITKLKEFIPVQIIPFLNQQAVDQKNKYSMKGMCQAQALRDAAEQKACVFLLNPDSMVSNGDLETCCQLIEQGYEAILIGELARVEIESIRSDLLSHYDPKFCCISLTQRESVSMGLNHFHKMGKKFFFNQLSTNPWPSILYWQVGKNSVLAKFFHLHPIAISMQHVKSTLPECLMPDDGGLIEFLGISQDKIHVIQDSEQLASIELSSQNLNPIEGLSEKTTDPFFHLLKWAFKYTLPSHKHHFCHLNLRFQGDEQIDWVALEKTINQSLWLIKALLKTEVVLRAFARKTGLIFLKKLWCKTYKQMTEKRLPI